VCVCFLGDLFKEPAVPLAGSAFLLAEDAFPARVPCFLDFFFFLLVGDEGTFDGYLGRVVAVEVCGVNFDAGDFPTCCS
jgi:hypothetical protein